MKLNLLSVAQTFLLLTQKQDSVNPVDAQGLMSPGHLYIKREITGAGGIYQLIDSSTKEQVGTSTFNQQTLPNGTKIVIERIRLGLAVVPKQISDGNNGKKDNPQAAIAPAGQYYTNVASKTEAAFRAANFIITRSQKQILRVPVSRFLTLDNVEGMASVADCFTVEELRLLEGNQQLELQLEFPNDVAWSDPTGNKVFLSVELFGPRMQF